MRRLAGRRLTAVLVLLLFVTSCGGGGADVTKIANLSAGDVKPPPTVDTKRSGLPGLFIATTSSSLRRLAQAPAGEGVVVLFVEPGGPSDGLGIGRGDLITKIAGETVKNHSRALALLHDRPGKEIEVEIRHRDGRNGTITIKPREPLVASLRQYLNPLIAASPKDAVLRFVRAQTPGPTVQRLQDLKIALDVDRRFVEAMSLRASLLWDSRPDDERRAERFAAEALEAWKRALNVEPDNTTVLTTRSSVLSSFGNPRQAQKDAVEAIELDPSHPRAYYARGVAEEALNRRDRAAGPARAAVELDPFNIQHWRLLARVFTGLNRKDDCRRAVSAFTPFLEARNLDRDAAALRSLCR